MALEVPAGWGQVPLEAKGVDLANPLEAAAKLQQDKATTDETQARTETMRAQLPGVTAESDIKTGQSQLARVATQNALIADAWSKIDPNDPAATDKMHAAMQDLADQGVTTAKQFLSVPYTQARASTVVGAFGAKSPVEGAAAMAGGGMASDQPTPQQVQEWDGRFSNVSPQQMQASLAKLDALKAALIRVANSPNPSLAWDQEAKALGHADWVGQYSGMRAKNAWDQTAPLDNYLRGRLTQTGMGVPAPPQPSEIKEVPGVGVVAVTPYGPDGKPAASTLVEGRPLLVGTDAEGRGVYEGAGGKETVGKNVLSQKPGTFGAGAGGAFEIRQRAYLAVHPGDEQGALEYARTGAGGSAGKQMGAAQIQIAANNQARADWNAMMNAGQPPPGEGEEAWVQARAAQYAQQFNAAQNDLGGGGPGGGGGAEPAVGRPGGVEADATQRSTVARNWETVNGQLQRYAGTGDRAWLARVKADQGRIEEAAVRMPPMANPGPMPPPRATALLKEGRLTRFDNGTGWSLRGGVPVRLW